MVLAAVGAGALPDVPRGRARLAAVGGFALGAALIVGVRWLTPKAGRKKENAATRTASPLVTVVTGVVICGLLVGAALAAGPRPGRLLTAEALFLALSGSAVLSRASASRGRMLLTTSLAALLLLSGAAAGGIILPGLPGGASGFALPLVAGALLYFVADELLIAARDERRPLLPAAVFCLGFFALLVVDVAA